MFKETQRKIAIFLALALMVSLLPMLPVFAASTYPVYFRNDNDWTDVRIYYYGHNENLEQVEMPGVPMTKEKAKDSGHYLYSANVPVSAKGILFTGLDAEGNRCQTSAVTDIQYDSCYCFAEDGSYTTYYFEEVILGGHLTSQNGGFCEYDDLYVVPPTCEASGYTVGECIYCGSQGWYDYVDALGHTPVEGSYEEVAATCTEIGGTRYTCANCNEYCYESTVDATGHTPKEGSEVVTEPNCTQGGYSTYACETCGASYEDSLTAPAGHTLGDNNTCDVCGIVPLVLEMTDRYGDGWNGCGIVVYINGSLVDTATVATGKTALYSLEYNEGNSYSFKWVRGSYPGECSFKLTLGQAVLMESDNSVCSGYTNGQLLYSLESKCSHAYDNGVVTAPTCTEDGYTTYTCGLCGTSYKSNVVAGGHNYQGSTCTVCGDAAKLEIVMKDMYSDGWNGAAIQICVNGEYLDTATLEQSTEDVYTLDYDALKEYSFYWVSGSYNSECSYDIVLGGKVLYSADADTCGEYYDGLLLYIVGSNCNHSYTSQVVAPGCVEEGYTLNTCSLCGMMKETNYTSPTGHDFGASITVAASCLQDGYTQTTCATCGVEKRTNEVDALPHTYGEDGLCSVCQARSLLTVEMHGNYAWYEPTCLGVYVDDVLQCNVSMRYSEEGAWSMTYDPTKSYSFRWTEGYSDSEYSFRILVNGEAVYMSNANCEDYTDGQEVFALNPTCDHSAGYVTETVAADCDTQGFDRHTCTACSYSYMDNFTAALGHSYGDNSYCEVCYADKPLVEPVMTPANATLSFEDEILMNVYFSVDNVQDVNYFGIALYSEQVADPANTEPLAYSDCGFNMSDTLYYVTTPGIAAKNMGDTVYFSIYAELYDGTKVYTKVYKYSPSSYAYNLLSYSSTSDTMKSLVVAMLNYGAAAQVYFGYNTDNLVNAKLTDAQKALVSDYSDDMLSGIVAATTAKKGELFAAGNTGFSKRLPSISFEGAFSINYYLTPSVPVNGRVTLYIWDAAAYADADTLLPDNAVYSVTLTYDPSGSYLGRVEGIPAKALGDTVYVAAVYTGVDGNQYTSGVMAYSVGAYCKGLANGTTTMAPFAKATAVYSYYAALNFNQ